MTDPYDKQIPPKSKTYDHYKPEVPRLPTNPFPWPRPGDYPDYPKLDYTPYLVIRASNQDDGTRPTASLDGGSPDIVIDGPTTTVFTLTNIAHLVPAPGSEQHIVARVWNFGDDAAVTARIRFFEVRTLQGSDPEPQLIAATFKGVPARSSVLVQCPEIWKPTNASRVSIMVDVSDTVRDPISSAFAPLVDRHVAQKIIVRQ